MFVAFSRILFVSADLPNALKFVQSLFRSSAAGGAAGPYAYAALAAAISLHFLPKDWERCGAARFFALRPWQQGTAYALATVALMAWATDPQPFVYFRF